MKFVDDDDDDDDKAEPLLSFEMEVKK